jgi:ABC-type branched-subunit amino acid transport system substrate-binding protein
MTDQTTGSESVPRRAVLGAVGTAGAVSVAGCGVLSSNGDDTSEQEAVIGISIPEDGRWENEGRLLQAGYLLATQDINSGAGPMVADGEYEPPLGEVSSGLSGETLNITTRNTSSTAQGAKQSANELAGEEVLALAGGGSPAEGLELQAVASEEEIIYLGGFTPTNKMGGEACSEYGFNPIQNSRLAADALGAVVPTQLPQQQRTFAQVHPDNEFGEELLETVEGGLSSNTRFRENRSFGTQVGAGSYTQTLEGVLNTQVSVVVLNYTGLNGAIALQDLANLAAEREGSNIQAIVPVMTRELLRNAGDALVIDGNPVLGTVPWSDSLDDPFTNRFLDSWAEADLSTDLSVSETPSALTHLGYVQLYQYAAAVERAGSTDPDAVISALEAQEYNVGPGPAEMRACDHQAIQPVPVVRGLPEIQQSPGNYTELVEVADVSYGCDEGPAQNCSL